MATHRPQALQQVPDLVGPGYPQGKVFKGYSWSGRVIPDELAENGVFRKTHWARSVLGPQDDRGLALWEDGAS